MLCLGIESTAHTFGVGIIEEKKGKCRIITNEKDMYHTEKGGFIPSEVGRHHVEVCDLVLRKALEKAKLQADPISKELLRISKDEVSRFVLQTTEDYTTRKNERHGLGKACATGKNGSCN